MKKIWLVGIGALVLTAMSANASLSFVWSNAQSPPNPVITPTSITFTDSVDHTTITLTDVSGVTFGTPTFDPTFNSLSSPLGPLGTGAEAFKVSFAGSSSLLKIDVSAGVQVLETAGDVVNAVPPAGVTRSETEVATPDGATFTEALSGAGDLSFDLTNFLFAQVPETNQLAVALGAALIGVTVLYRFRRSAAVR